MKVMIALLLLLTACGKEKINEHNIDKVPLCSSGNKVELDVEYLKQHDVDTYNTLPTAVRKYGFRPMICKPG
jgi:hypothetical protein